MQNMCPFLTKSCIIISWTKLEKKWRYFKVDCYYSNVCESVMHFYAVDGATIAEMFTSENFWMKVVREAHALAAWPLLILYNGKKGKNISKWFFYGFYPGHLLFIYLLTLIIF